MNFFKLLSGVLLSAALVACGGGGGSPGANGTSTGGASTPTATVTAVVSDFILALDKTSINNAGSDNATLNVVALTAAGNVVPNAPVSVAVDNGGVYSGVAATDAAGAATGRITTPGNKTNRSINVTVTIGSVVKVATLAVTGSLISVSPVPAVPSPGQSTSIDMRLTDSAGNGIASQNLTISGTAGFSGVVATNATGNASFVTSAPAVAGTYTVVVSGSGVSTQVALLVIAPGGGGVPDAVGTISSTSLNANPTSVNANLGGSTSQRARLTFKVEDASLSGIPNVRVKFSLRPPVLGSGEFITSGNEIVYTNAAGEATADYVPGSRTSPTDGVKIRACYGANDAAVNACATFVDTSLTVGGQALNLSIFDNNTMSKGLGGIMYIKQFVVQVADSVGTPVADALISGSVDITHFGKGYWGTPTYLVTGGIAPTIANTYTSTVGQLSATTTPTDGGARVWCVNEDLNRNGSINTTDGDDLDGDNVLEPRKSDIAVSFVGSNRTDSSGQVLMKIEYGQNLGTWLAYTLKVTTSVAGSEGTNSRAFMTNVLEEDVDNGSFRTPPFGVNNCATNN